MGENDFFNKALADYVSDFACGGAIRRLADAGYSVTEIMERLAFPMDRPTVAKLVWKHDLAVGRICRKEDYEAGEIRRFSYVEEHSAYGRSSMRRVEEVISLAGKEYLACDFGKRLYRDEKGFRKELEKLDPGDREYILDLPWPADTVYHVADERMRRIRQRLEQTD